MTTAPAFDQARLLDVQSLDTRLAQIAHQQRTLPENAEVEKVQQEVNQVRDDLVRAKTLVSDVQRDLKRAEADVEVVRQREKRDRDLLDQGVGSAKDQMGLQHELETLKNRREMLEELELEAMERLEAAGNDVTALEAKQAALAQTLSTVQARRDKAHGELVAEHDKVKAERETIIGGLDAGLVSTYERCRESGSGLGAALLRRGQCEGCRMPLTAVDLGAFKTARADALMFCPECDRILIRTGESGL